MLLRLVGPDELIAGAVAVAEADGAFRALWFDREPGARQAHSAEMSEVLLRGRHAFNEFTELARRLTTPV